MNKTQRETLTKLHSQLNDIRNEIEGFQEEEAGKFDNMSEGLQQGETGQAIQAAAENLENCVSSLDEALQYLDDSTQ